MDLRKKEYNRKGTEPPAGVTQLQVPERKMKNSELKKYLNMFPDDENVVILLANPKERKKYEHVDTLAIIDQPIPILCIEVGKESDLDEDEIAACEEDEREAEQLAGQMNITDFPEVLP